MGLNWMNKAGFWYFREYNTSSVNESEINEYYDGNDDSNKPMEIIIINNWIRHGAHLHWNFWLNDST